MLNTPNEWHNEENTEEYSEEEFSDDYENQDYEEDEDFSEEDENSEVENEDQESQNKKKMIIIASATILIILLLVGGALILNSKKSKDSAKTTDAIESVEGDLIADQNTDEEIEINTESGDDVSIEIEDPNSLIPTEKPLTTATEAESLMNDNSGLAIPTDGLKTDDGGLQVEVEEYRPGALADKKPGAVTVSIGDIGRQNPFMPKDKVGTAAAGSIAKTNEDGLNFEVIEPPQLADENPDITKLLETKVSGILYDPKKPSAIINIEGVDQLVKVGDVLSGFEIIAITQNKVVISSDSNVYRASVGQPLNAELVQNYVEISNLETKFKGSKRFK